MNGRCVYCGTKLIRGTVCHAHSDLRALDPWWETARYKRWWLDRYSLDEIRELAACLEPTTREQVAA